MTTPDRPLNQKITLTGEVLDDDTQDLAQAEGVLFTLEQYATITDALGLTPDATPDDAVAAITALAEQLNQSVEKVEEQIAASAVIPQGVTIDAHTWRDMKRSIERGLTMDKQEHRLAAEQTVDQAIRLGKANAYQREKWIAAYQADPETTVHALNRAQEIPRIEIGYGLDATRDNAGNPAPKGWVR